ncbi:UDP-N-acetylmuramoyl-L-alanyl-D-glutamate--2,6-diaminopimelate ligase [Puniceicoccaceae bacterium K14]|nr:UDP-N-acetylmuramoyl-L-alanyl-D-glutamate--2,6-diaminopimelate ligase [Puniceicoccaceae bacterium K14]
MSALKENKDSSGEGKKKSRSKKASKKAKPRMMSSLVKSAGLKFPKKESDTLVSRLAIDSRRVIPGSLFFAIEGLKTDGNKFVDEAISRGAVGIVTARPPKLHGSKVAYIKSEDPRLSLARVSRAFFDFPDEKLLLVGVTGTNGKTTVTGLIKDLLRVSGGKVGSLGTVGYDLVQRSLPSFRTTPEAHDLCELLSQMNDFECEGVVMEVSSHAIDQLRVAELAFDVGVFLNLTRDHLDYHGDMEQYFAVKRRLFTGEVGAKPKRVVVNADDSYGRRLIEEFKGEDLTSFGFAEDADVRGLNLQLESAFSAFDVVWPEGKGRVTTNLIGRYNVSNVLAALATAYVSGLDVNRCIERLKTFEGIPGRMQLIENSINLKIVVDYAHTADALTNALSLLNEITRGKVIVVFGCGGDRDRGKRSLMAQAALANSDFSWATSDNPRTEAIEQIFDDMKEGVQSSDADRIEFIADRRRAIELALKSAKPEDCILIAGKGHETFQEFGDTVVPFDDRQVAYELSELIRLGGEQSR